MWEISCLSDYQLLKKDFAPCYLVVVVVVVVIIIIIMSKESYKGISFIICTFQQKLLSVCPSCHAYDLGPHVHWDRDFYPLEA
jgi:hypothetical protein